MPEEPLDDPGDLTYSEAVARGLYGSPESHVDALDALATDSVTGPATGPRFGRTERSDFVRLPRR